MPNLLQSFHSRLFDVQILFVMEMFGFLLRGRSEMRRFAEELKSMALPRELRSLSSSGRGTLLVDRMADGFNKFWSGDHVLEDGAWVGLL